MKEEERRSLTPLQLRKKAAEFALKTVDQQREQFKRCVEGCVHAAQAVASCPWRCRLIPQGWSTVRGASRLCS